MCAIASHVVDHVGELPQTPLNVLAGKKRGHLLRVDEQPVDDAALIVAMNDMKSSRVAAATSSTKATPVSACDFLSRDAQEGRMRDVGVRC
jgi:hypothetical protein